MTDAVTWSGSWGLVDMPAQRGRRTLVTGCTRGGLGFHAALELSRAGGSVVMAGRSGARLSDAEDAVRAEVPGADVSQLVVDLADLSSVRKASDEVSATGPLHCLLNNAGVMATPHSRTPDGLELQMATNHFGPFLLTGLLLPQLAASGDGRVVTVSSQMHRVARAAPLGDPRQPPARYRRWPQYAASKLANLLFTFELDRRLAAAGLPVRALAAHPGYAGTHLVANGRFGRPWGGAATILDAANRAVSQSAADGALPLLMSATADLPGGSYCGPRGVGQARGRPRLVGTSRLATDEGSQRLLWELSEQTVGLPYP